MSAFRKNFSNFLHYLVFTMLLGSAVILILKAFVSEGNLFSSFPGRSFPASINAIIVALIIANTVFIVKFRGLEANRIDGFLVQGTVCQSAVQQIK